MIHGIPPAYVQRVSRAFAWAYKNATCFVHARTTYKRLKDKNLLTTSSIEDLKLKVEALDIYKSVMQQDLMDDKFHKQYVYERIDTSMYKHK